VNTALFPQARPHAEKTNSADPIRIRRLILSKQYCANVGGQITSLSRPVYTPF
jgi:hypothetical protein